jgi:putative ABC transport system substrate-binding protein
MNRREFATLAMLAAIVQSSDAHAESRIFKVALLTLDSSETADQLKGPLAQLGYVEGRNLAFIHRTADNDAARLGAIAEELVRERPDVMVAGFGTLVPKALMAATHDIPIVFSTVGDPVGAGLVQSLSYPGGNVTGFSGQSTEFKGKQLELLLDCLPGENVVGVLLNPDTPYTGLALKQLEVAADKRGVKLVLLRVRRPTEFTAREMDLLAVRGATSLFIIEDPLISVIRSDVIEQARRLRLPTITGLSEYARDGGLMSYGVDRTDLYRRTAGYVDRILKGAKPGDLPVEQPTKFRLILNLKTAKAFNLTLPPSILVAAEEVIE